MRIGWQTYDLILKDTFTISGYSRRTTPVVLVKLEYEGFTGYGEASLPQYLGETQDSVIDFYKKIDISRLKDPFRIEEIMLYLDELACGNTAAKASIDIALHDLTGKMMNKPLFSILGLDKSETPFTSYTIGMGDRESVIRKVTEASDNFRILKIKLGGNNDKDIIEAVRTVTDLPLAVDANQGWTEKERALDFIYWLKDKGVILIEQPMPKTDIDNTAWLTENSPLPVFADESVQRLTDIDKIKGVFSGINIKLMKCTGLYEAHKMIGKAASAGLDTMLGCMTETSCAVSAAAQLSPLVNFADLDGNLLIGNDCFEGCKVIGGKIVLNDDPGIGVRYKSL